VRLAKKYEPDLICLDIKMPGKSGYEVMETLSEDPKLCSIPVVVVSSASDEAAELDNHAHCYLTKPIDAADLLSVVQQTLVQKIDSVLIVEDDPVIAMLLGQAFREHDVHVVTATNGEEGLQRLGEGKPSAILLDLMMPVMDGFQFLRTIRQDPEFADLPVVVLTSKTLTSTDIQFLGELSDFVFSKESYSAAQVIIAILTASRSERTPREITK
jgi:CheY-like chemotaxis protein